MSRKPTKADRLNFHRGMLAALAVVKDHDNETLFREIVDTAGAKELLAACEADEDFEWTGLAKYGYVSPGEEEEEDDQSTRETPHPDGAATI